MTDYIKREDAINFIANGVCTDTEDDMKYTIKKFNDEIPSADVVERDSAGYEWCEDCKEYDHERHCCPRWNKVIRDTMDEIRQNAEENWDKVEVVRCKDCKHIKEEHFKIMPDGYSCDLSGLMVEQEHYCSYGEREEQ